MPAPKPTAEDGTDRIMLSQNDVNIEGGVTPEADCKLSIGKRYFTDMNSSTGKPDAIYITIIVTNTSQHYKVQATMDTSTPATVFADGKIVATAYGATSIILDETGDGATGELTYKLELQKTGDEYAELDVDTTQIALKMTFEKYVANIRNELSISDNKIWVNMGQDFSDNDLRWYAIAYNPNGTGAEQVDPTAYTTLKAGVDYTDVSQIPAGNYIFISEYILIEANGDYHIAFTDSSSDHYTEANDWGVHYNGSTVQQYLAGISTNNIFTTYNISQTQGFYAKYINQIDLAGEAPSLRHEYKTDFVTNDTADQKLWLLSDEEYKAFFGDGNSAGMGNVLGEDFAGNWWLRSPFSVDDVNAIARFVGSTGLMVISDVNRAQCGVRAAFQITIPA